MTGLLAHLMDVSIRSFAVAIFAFALLRIRTLRTAAWAHAIWTGVLLSMLLLFMVGTAFKPIPLRILPAPKAALAQEGADLGLRPLLFDRGASVPSRELTLPASPRRSLTAGEVMIGVYVAVAIILLARLLVGSWLSRRLLAGSVRAGATFYESPQIAIPLTIGWLRPVILLPASWRGWDSWKLEAALLHESSHVQRRDSLILLLAGLNQCVFWFHPLAWWLERKLAFLAERACDEACVSRLENRPEYARLLIEMAGVVEASGGRLSFQVMPMARPSQVRRRVDAILDDTRVAHQGLNAFSWAVVLLCSILAVTAAGSMSIETKLPQPLVSTLPAVARPAASVTQFGNPSIPHRAPILVAQAPTAAPPSVQPATNSTESLVVLPVSVVDQSGRSVTGLDRSNFRITEGPNARPITTFDVAEGKHAIALINTIKAGPDAIDAFQQALDPRDESFVTDGPPATDTEAFLDAIAAVVSQVKQKQNAVKAVVVITQGGHSIPWAPVKNVSSVLRLTAHTPRVAIFFANLEGIKEAVSLADLSPQDDMHIIAGGSGGQVVTVARPEEMTTALKQIAAALRYQYLLGFVRSDFPLGPLGRPSFEIVRIAGLPPLRVIGPLIYGQ